MMLNRKRFRSSRLSKPVIWSLEKGYPEDLLMRVEVFTYWVTNITKEPLVLDESMFYVQGVRAVAFFPETQLAPNQSTRVLIVSETKTEVQ